MRTSWTSLVGQYGFHKPYNFRVAIPFLLSAIGALTAVILVAVMYLNGALHVGSERFYFFVYMIVALGIAAVLSKRAVLSFSILLWCFLEAVLAIASHVTPASWRPSSLFPRDHFTEPANRKFTYHPLLQLVPKRNWRETKRYDERNRSMYEGWPMNWTQVENRELVFSHNSLGLRGREPSEKDLSREMIFVYGGSTTYDITVTQGDTWVEQVERELAGRYTILNFGVDSHSTVEHLIHTAFYQRARGKRPICAVYYVGWNDIHNAHIDNLDPAYADWHLLITPGDSGLRPELWAAKYSPLIRLAQGVASRRFNLIPEPPSFNGEVESDARDRRLEGIFSDNVRTISAINRSRGIETVFIGQVLNKPYLLIRPDEVNRWAPRVRNRDIWLLQERFNVVLRQVAETSGAHYVDAGIDNFNVNDFTDQGHFSSIGSRKFAQLVARGIEESCHPRGKAP